MGLSEKSLELNVGAELLWLIRTHWGKPKAYLRGLTQREEKKEGVDFYAQLDPDSHIFAFQFKEPKGPKEEEPYRFRIVREQHEALEALAKSEPDSVNYVFPFYVTPQKLQNSLPNLLAHTWMLKVVDVPSKLFNGQDTIGVSCIENQASINPDFPLTRATDLAEPRSQMSGITLNEFARWYREFIQQGGSSDLAQLIEQRRNPWITRSLRIVIVPPHG